MLSLFLLALSILLAAAEVVLGDGQILQAAEVRQENGNYLIVMDTGETLSIPVELVQEVRLTGQKRPEPRREGAFVYDDPQNLAGPDILDDDKLGPTGLKKSQPQTLAGQAVRPPSRSEQTAALGPPAQFQQGLSDPTWRPETDWNMDPSVQNNWAPSTWSKNIVDSDWQPESAYDPKADVLADSRSTFTDSIVDNSWQPTDGFAKKSSW